MDNREMIFNAVTTLNGKFEPKSVVGSDAILDEFELRYCRRPCESDVRKHMFEKLTHWMADNECAHIDNFYRDYWIGCEVAKNILPHVPPGTDDYAALGDVVPERVIEAAVEAAFVKYAMIEKSAWLFPIQ
jgi:hypothetical protein